MDTLTANTITVFGDIHANIHALQAVLDDMARRDAQNLHCLGDLVGYGVFPNEVVAAIRERDIPTIIGNYDEGVGHDSDDCGCVYKEPVAEALGKLSIAWSNTHTTDKNKTFLRELHPSIPIQLGDLRVLLVHGSPRRINEYLFADRPDATFERILNQAEADVLVCGHTHLPYHKVLPSGRHVVNAGSVGKPKDHNPDACYVTLSAKGAALSVAFTRVAYDVEAAAGAIEATGGMPHEYAQMLRDGSG